MEGGGFEGRRKVLIHLVHFTLEKGNFLTAFEKAGRNSLAGGGMNIYVACKLGIFCTELFLSMKLKSNGRLFKKLSNKLSMLKKTPKCWVVL